MLNGFSPQTSQLPLKSSDLSSAEITPRGNGYGESYNLNLSPDGLDALLAEGSYFSGVANAYAPGTGVAAAATQTTFVDTSAFIIIANSAKANSNKLIRPDTIKMICSAVGTGITAMRMVAVLDNISRLGIPGGTGLVFSPNGGLSGIAQSIASGFVGSLTVGAVTNAKRIVGQCVIKAAAPALNDEFILRFSNSAQPNSSLVSATASTIIRQIEPIVIPPQQCLILHYFSTGGTAAASFETVVTQIER